MPLSRVFATILFFVIAVNVKGIQGLINGLAHGSLKTTLISWKEPHQYIPEKEIQAIVAKGKDVVPTLIYLLSSHTFYEPLNPGYGRSPIFAAKCLSEIQDERAIPVLFEALGQDNFFTDEEIIKALASFGNLSKAFLITRLKSVPFSNDNEYAAIALSGFTDDSEIGFASLEVLEKEDTLKKPLFASYLVFACSNLDKASEQERFIAITKKKNLPKTILEEMMIVVKNWKAFRK